MPRLLYTKHKISEKREIKSDLSLTCSKNVQRRNVGSERLQRIFTGQGSNPKILVEYFYLHTQPVSNCRILLVCALIK